MPAMRQCRRRALGRGTGGDGQDQAERVPAGIRATAAGVSGGILTVGVSGGTVGVSGGTPGVSGGTAAGIVAGAGAAAGIHGVSSSQLQVVIVIVLGGHR